LVDENIWSWWQQQWRDNILKETRTKQLKPRVRDWENQPHGVSSYYLPQILTGHGCFQAYLLKFIPVEIPHCLSCKNTSDDAEHTFFKCHWWAKKLEFLETAIQQIVIPEIIISIMLRNKGNYKAVERYVTQILVTKTEEERLRK